MNVILKEASDRTRHAQHAFELGFFRKLAHMGLTPEQQGAVYEQAIVLTAPQEKRAFTSGVLKRLAGSLGRALRPIGPQAGDATPAPSFIDRARDFAKDPRFLSGLAGGVSIGAPGAAFLSGGE